MFLGREFGKPREHSEQTQVDIDNEVHRILIEAEQKATRLVQDNIEILHRLAKALLERETLDAESIDLIMQGQDLPPTNPPSGGGDDGESRDTSTASDNEGTTGETTSERDAA
jgi:cell division protease FtsH